MSADVCTHQHKLRLHYHANAIQNRVAAAIAVFMAVFLLCIEHARAFANQYHVTAYDAMALASAASTLSRKLSSTYLSSDMKKSFPRPGPLGTTRGVGGEVSSTKLSMAWSIPAIALPNMPSIPTSKDLPVHTLGSWYSEVDPTTKPPVYDDDFENSYSFSSPTDDWPSMSNNESELSKVQKHVRTGPLRSIRRIARRFVSGEARNSK
mmetsp:Transcript_5240/g.11497  ORF Transcript_5240/g.11497 Transcript_5240/m.11497 type:complete len:208 (+) Transcript_5240:384-1007(+)|eukprot:CAMPEP_0171329276 /NCGR_PEP_ID=MMETSP0878-20121228/1171_1 /TAXON_ID=67004 /ORGANISM="Thalassiosira weissflogii, Strain CCMP1336" /LENGTH=207 /DNA_ID=CAMNT_0011829239 /DNA_START=349 /DNA_END=972 /DNA_ORIENTATION=+